MGEDGSVLRGLGEMVICRGWVICRGMGEDGSVLRENGVWEEMQCCVWRN